MLRLRLPQLSFLTRTRSFHTDFTMTASSGEKLALLRELMASKDLGVYIVPSEDAHQSEYTSVCDQRRAYISGFTGSAGTAIITPDTAALATDGRYFLQADEQLDKKHWNLLKQGVKGVPTWQEYAIDYAVKHGVNIGVDSRLVSAVEAEDITKKLSLKIEEAGVQGDEKKSSSVQLIGLHDNLVDTVWSKLDTQPCRPGDPAFPLDVEYTGKPFDLKLEELRVKMRESGGSAIIISALDEIAWLLNLRGSDIPYNPVFFGYVIVTPNYTTLYCDSKKITEACEKHLDGLIDLKPYDEVFADFKKLGDAAQHDKLVFVPKNSSWALVECLGGFKNEHKTYTQITSPVLMAKAVKNKTEQQGARTAHLKDGAALCEFFCWLEGVYDAGNPDKLDEVDAASKLVEFRQKQPNFVGLSFESISSVGPNAAIIHYAPEKPKAAILDPSKVYLSDTGSQFLEGTTDTTRTWHFGTPSDEERTANTLVLKGHISLAESVFPEGTTGFALDILARQFLWKYGLDYRHGTGHGIGAFLNVHEGPFGIGFRPAYRDFPMEIGNVVSNEPGYYKDGEYGIRIESVLVCKEKKTKENFGGKKYLGFETITRVPLCHKLIDVSMLEDSEKKWVNNYHKIVRDEVGPLVEGEVKEWLLKETAPLE